MFPEFQSDNLPKKESAILEKMESNKEFIQTLLKIDKPTFQNFAKPYQRIQTELSDLVTEISHLNSSKKTTTRAKLSIAGSYQNLANTIQTWVKTKTYLRLY